MNHFASEHRLIRFFENKLARIYDVIGFKSNFSIHSIQDYKYLKILTSHKINLFGYWKLLHCKTLKEG